MRDSKQRGMDAASSAAEADDRALAQACLAGTPGAWDAFVGRFAGLFRHVVDRTCSQRRLSLSAADRDDVVAEILVELLKGDAAALRAWAGRASLPSYLTVIARRTAVRMTAHAAANAPRTAAPATSAGKERAEERQHADREEVERLIARLDPAEARLIRLHHIEGRSYGEISRLTGLPLGSIGPALSKARQRMRAETPLAGGPGAAGDGSSKAG